MFELFLRSQTQSKQTLNKKSFHLFCLGQCIYTFACFEVRSVAFSNITKSKWEDCLEFCLQFFFCSCIDEAIVAHNIHFSALSPNYTFFKHRFTQCAWHKKQNMYLMVRTVYAQRTQSHNFFLHNYLLFYRWQHWLRLLFYCQTIPEQ